MTPDLSIGSIDLSEVNSLLAIVSACSLCLIVILAIVGIVLLIKKKIVGCVISLIIILVLLGLGVLSAYFAVDWDDQQDDYDYQEDLEDLEDWDDFVDDEDVTNNDNPIDDSLEDDQTEDDTTIFTNEIMGYQLDIGDAECYEKMTEVETWPQWAVISYVYCHDTNLTGYEGESCGTGTAEIFRISIYSETEYNAMVDSPLGLAGEFLGSRDFDDGTDTESYYVFEHPNGDLPSDVELPLSFYDDVPESFEFL
ncbi:MAG: hypothetical protein U9Q67_01860 [Patescibacteria group bacterium]|nr:hypothetical protein [Patescibacteria group bacterium]